MQKVYNWDNLPVNLDMRYVCIVLGVTESTVKRWLYKGTLKGSKIGRKWFFSKDYIKSLTEAGK